MANDYYTAGQASIAAGVPYSMIDHWSHTDLVEPSVQVADGSRTCRLFSLQDLVAFRMVRELRGIGVELKAMRPAVKHIQSIPLRGGALLLHGDGEYSWYERGALKDSLPTTFICCVLDGLSNEVKSAVMDLAPPMRGKACNPLRVKAAQ